MIWKGTLRKVDLGSGGWMLEAEGKRFTLVGDVPAGLEGKRVEVQGRSVEGGGFLMTGDPMVEIKKIREA